MKDADTTECASITFLSLPNEVLELVAEHLPFLRLKTFSTLSKRLRGVAVRDLVLLVSVSHAS